MAKLFKLSEETQNLIDEVVDELGLNHYMNFKCFGINKQKQVIKVKKASPTEEGMGGSTDCVIIIVVEDIFERLSLEQQNMLLKDALMGVSYDDEKDKIVVIQPEISVSLGGWQKWGEDLVRTQEIALLTKASVEEEERERKNVEKGK